MIELKDLLAPFEKILNSSELMKEVVINVLNKNLSVSLKKEDVKIKDNNIILNIKPIYKSEILVKKDKILKDLEFYLGNKTPRDFR